MGQKKKKKKKLVFQIQKTDKTIWPKIIFIFKGDIPERKKAKYSNFFKDCKLHIGIYQLHFGIFHLFCPIKSN